MARGTVRVVDAPRVACLRCEGRLEPERDGYYCLNCGAAYLLAQRATPTDRRSTRAGDLDRRSKLRGGEHR
jgi:hypothetical protein